jgi:hypothetical protein
MMGSRVLCLAGVVAVGVATVVFQFRAVADEPATPAHDHEHMAHGGAMDQCAKACSACQRECESCSAHCARLVGEGKSDHLTTLATCRDCADFCATAAGIVSRGGPFTDVICQACAEACARCGKACEKHAHDAHMKACADECRKCEKACRAMVRHAGH